MFWNHFLYFLYFLNVLIKGFFEALFYLNLYFLETSAKNNENVQKIFYYFTYKLIQYFNKNKYTEEDKIELTTTKAEELPTIRPGESKCNC